MYKSSKSVFLCVLAASLFFASCKSLKPPKSVPGPLNYTDEDIVKIEIDRINKLVSETPYSCSIGYSYSDDGSKTIDQLVKESDDMMYRAKAKHYDDLKTNIEAEIIIELD